MPAAKVVATYKPTTKTAETTRAHIRRTFAAFRDGARLDGEDIDRLLTASGLRITPARLRTLSRANRSSVGASAVELYALISTWADEQHQDAAR